MTFEQAIEALEENDKMKAELKDCRKMLRESGCEITELKEENDKLKKEINRLEDCWNGLNRVFNEVCDEKHKLKEELEQSKVNEESALCQMANAIETSVELQSQMSAVEVLDFFANTYQNPKLMYDIFGKQSVVSILRKINAKKVTSKEIVEKITEYEKSKENNSEDFLHTNLDEYFNEDVSNSKESFKVGDYVKVVMGVNKGIQGTIKEFNFFNNKVLLDNHYHVLLKEIEHAEPKNEEQKKTCFSDYENGCDVCSYAKKHEYEYPCCDCTHGQGTNEHFTTEEPNFEWVWGCNYADDTKTRFWAKSEEEAISWCENYMLEVGCDTTYRKVCRKK